MGAQALADSPNLTNLTLINNRLTSLPPEIIKRRNKGRIDQHIRNVLDANLDFVRDVLLNGRLVKEGLLTKRAPTPSERRDIDFGWHLAKEMGRLDVGQSVAVKERAALAVEAIEGTDRCIERAGMLCRAGGWTLVKVAKPNQDMRFDVPVIGVETLRVAGAAKLRVIAVEAGKTLLLERESIVDLAKRSKISIVAR